MAMGPGGHDGGFDLVSPSELGHIPVIAEIEQDSPQVPAVELHQGIGPRDLKDRVIDPLLQIRLIVKIPKPCRVPFLHNRFVITSIHKIPHNVLLKYSLRVIVIPTIEKI